MTRGELERVMANLCIIGKSTAQHMLEGELPCDECSNLMDSFVEVVQDTLERFVQEEISDELRKQLKQ